ncbi:hypothetical protein HXX76_006079 [Chlamydomonas incerta]|uniref:Uncharacterized protein n=1 Tax=Chlamydomonas incerta TaxID=51695 RepID=A0A835W1T5_CHLIN|nr:hypothetical protein HXX76_006079 [Chlamydomonas incerta]|eukprot:KAG2437427.1 hypothetical protein HXX76_006079 [Chlamydomonas incerta]
MASETQLYLGPPAPCTFEQAFPIVCSNLGASAVLRLVCRSLKDESDRACQHVRLPLANSDTLRALGSPQRGPPVTHKEVATLLTRVKPRALSVYTQGASKIETLVDACSSPACAEVEELRIFGSLRLSPASAPRGLREPGSVAARLAAALPNLRRLTIATDSLLDTGAHLRQTEPLPSAPLLSPSASACSSLSAAAATADAASAVSPRACGTPCSNAFGHEFGNAAGAGADADSGLDVECGGVGASMEVWLLRLLGPRLQSLTLQPLVREMAAGAAGGAIHFLPLSSADAFTSSQDPESSPLWAALCSLKGLRELDLGCQMLPAWLFPAVPRPRPRLPPPRCGAASTPPAWLAAAAAGGTTSVGAGSGPRAGVCVQSWVRMALSGSAASGSGLGPSSSGDYESGCNTDSDYSDDVEAAEESEAAAAACGGLAAVWPRLTRLAAGGILGLAAPSDDGFHADGHGGGAAPSGLALPPRGFRQLQLREPQSVAALAAIYRATSAAEALVAVAEARAAAAEARGGLRPRQLWAAAAAHGFSLAPASSYFQGGAADAPGYPPGPFIPSNSACLYGELPAVAAALGQGYEPDSPPIKVAAAAAAGTSSCPASPAAKAAQSGIHAPCSASCSSCAAALASTMGVLGKVMARAPGDGLAAQPNVLLLHTSHITPWAEDGAGASGASPLSSLSESPETETHHHHVSRAQHNHNPQHRPQQQQQQRAQAAAVPTAAAADAAAAALAKRLRERNAARRPSAAPHLPTHNEDEEGERHKRRQQHSFFTATRGAPRGSIDLSEASSSDGDHGDDEEQAYANEPAAQPRHDMMADAVALLVRGGGRCRALTVRMSESPAAAGVTAGGAPPGGALAGGSGSCCAGSFWRYGCRAAEGPHQPWLAALAPLDAAGLRTLTLCCFSFAPGDMAALAAALPGLRDGGCLVLEHCPLPPSAAAELRAFAEVRCRGLPPPQPLLLSQRSLPQLALTRAAQELQDQLQLLRLRRSASGMRNNAPGCDGDALSAAVATAAARVGASRLGGSGQGQGPAQAPAAVTTPEGKGADSHGHDHDDDDDTRTWSRVRIAPWVEAAEARARAGRQAAATAVAAALTAADTDATKPVAVHRSAAGATAAAQARTMETAPLRVSGIPSSCYSTSSASAVSSSSSSSHTGPAGESGSAQDWGRPLQPRGRWQSDCGVSAVAAAPLPLLGSGGVQPCAAAATAMDAAERYGVKQCGGRAGEACADSAPAYAPSCTLACADSVGAEEHGAAQQRAAGRPGGSGAVGASSSNSGGSGGSSAARVRRPAGNLALALRASASSQRRRAGASASPGS